MERHGFVEGTTGITYVHKKDDRRHRKHCVHYRKDGSCAYMSRCGGSAHCQLYSETECKSEISVVTKDKINIITEEKNVNESVQEDSAIAFQGIQTIRLDDIIVPDKFLRKQPNPKKVDELHNYYNEHKKLDKPIYVLIKDGKYYLEDKYLRYYVAKELGKTWINARVGTYAESIKDELHKIGSRVHHKKYGIGTIMGNDGKYVAISFDIGKEAEFNIEMCIKNEILKWKN